MDETVEWCNSFIIMPKPNDTVCLCLDPTGLNKVLITAVHRGPIINYIQPKLRNVCLMVFTDASSGYHGLKHEVFLLNHICMSVLQEQFHQTTMEKALADGMVQKNIVEIFKSLMNVFSIADDSLIAGYDADGKDHDKTLEIIDVYIPTRKCKCNKHKCHFRCIRIPSFGEIIPRNSVQLNLRKCPL